MSTRLTDNLPDEVLKAIEEVGLDKYGFDSSSYYLKDETEFQIETARESGLIVTSIKEAYRKGWLDNYLYTLVKPYVPPEKLQGGFFIRVPKGLKVSQPLTTCFLLTKDMEQYVANVIVVEEGASLDLFVGCSRVSYNIKGGKHLATTEVFVGKNASFTYSMIHMWAPDTEVYPRTGALVEENGKIAFNYASLREIRNLVSNPKIKLKANAEATVNNLIYLPKGAIDMGGVAELLGEGAKAKLISRMVVKDGHGITRGLIVASSPKVIGHIECDGMILSDKGKLTTLPGLEANYSDVQLTHEASIGKVSDEELEWLVAKGFTEEEALELIVKGFLDPASLDMPESIKLAFKEALGLSDKGYEKLMREGLL